MKKLINDLDVIKKTFNEIEAIQRDSELLEALAEAHDLSRKTILSEPDADFFMAASRTLKDDPKKAQSTYTAYISMRAHREFFNFDAFARANALVLGKSGPSPLRKTDLNAHYPFPRPESLNDGVRLLEEFLLRKDLNIFFQTVAFVQAFISLHPFTDGNARTARVLLEASLRQMNLPPCVCRTQLDFIFANPCDRQVFTLKHAVTLVLMGLGRSLQI